LGGKYRIQFAYQAADSDGANLGTFPTGQAPRKLAFDGVSIWSANAVSNTVTKLRRSDGLNQGTFAVGRAPDALAYDGVSMWVTNFVDNTVTRLRLTDGQSMGTRPDEVRSAWPSTEPTSGS